MSNSINHWDNNVSKKTKIAVAKALGCDLDRQCEIHIKLANAGAKQRAENARIKIAERRAKRELENKTKSDMEK